MPDLKACGHEAETVLPSSLSISTPSDASLPDIQELLYPSQVSLPDTTLLGLNNTISSSKTEPDTTTLHDNALFLKFLRSRSSSCFLKQKGDNDKKLCLQSLLVQNVCASGDSSFGPAASIEPDVIEIPDSPPPIKKPKIILRVKKPEVQSSVKPSKKGILKSNGGHVDPKNHKRHRPQSTQSISHKSTAVELRTTISRRTRIGREVKPTKKAAEARQR